MVSGDISLPARLQAVADFVVDSIILCDVGCDHGKLSVYVLEHGLAEKVLASDINEMPLKSAINVAKNREISGNIEFFLADGLNFERAKQADTVVIAGMGGETIAGILERALCTRCGVRLILQPQTKPDFLCEWLSEHGYGIENAKIVRDTGRLYVILLVKGGISSNIYVEDVLLEKKDPLLLDWLDWNLSIINRALEGAKQSRNGREGVGRMERERERLVEIKHKLLTSAND